MASTYSDLKIQLMSTGENSGTWGTVTNTNLGTAVEEAIVGSSDVTFSNADVTLTWTDTNASQSARNLRLNLTGTVTTTQSLIVPAIEKVYIINNGLTQSITVKNSTGTGIAVPAGKTMYVYNNATNVVDAVTHLTSLTLATALPVASGGTGSTTATFSGANITSLNASSVSSGTLSNDRLDIVSVAKGGTGSSTATFSGANITSLNASSVSSGTLAVGNGGTGQTTYTNGQLLIGNTTGNTLTKATLTGTSNQITVTNGGGSITLATPQDIGTSSNVQHGSLGIGTAASGTTGEIRATNNVTAYYSSDRRFKENIRPIENALSSVDAIGGVMFDWTDEYIKEHGGEDGYFVQKEDFGVIAQDVQKVFPQAVREREDGSLAVDYSKLVALAFAAIKELAKRVENLEGE